MTNKELLDKIRNEILHLKMKELQRTNGVNTGADVYLSSYAVLSILSNALTEESEDERIRKWLVDYFSSIKKTVWVHRDITCEQILEWLEKQEQKPAEWSEELDIDTLREWSMRYAPDIRQAIESTAYHFYNLRPHWKPSEEQIYSLGTIVKGAGENNVGSIGYILKELYEQLKKL